MVSGENDVKATGTEYTSVGGMIARLTQSQLRERNYREAKGPGDMVSVI